MSRPRKATRSCIERSEEANMFDAAAKSWGLGKDAARRLGAVLLCAVSVSGCSNIAGGSFESASPYAAVHPITVQNEPTLMTVPLSEGLGEKDAKRIAAFGREYARLGSGPMSIGYPRGARASAQIGQIVKILHKEGVPTRAIVRGSYNPAEFDGEGIVVFFERPTAVTAECPQLWGETMILPHNGASGRLGCATQQNLAAMAADPRDFKRPAPMPLAQSGPRLRVLDAAASGKATQSQDAGGTTTTTN